MTMEFVASPRGEAWNFTPYHLQEPEVNVGETERLASLLVGGALALYGMSRGTVCGLATALGGGMLVYRGLSGHCMGYEALGISTADKPESPAASVPAGAGVKVEKAITIHCPPAELYRYWRDFANLPRFMKHLQSVTTIDPNRSHWIAAGPLRLVVEWDAEVINEKENELIAWRSLPGSEVDTAGSVHFIAGAGHRSTEVKVTLKYNPPAGKAGAAIARWFSEAPEQQIEEDLQRFKQLMEAGEKATRKPSANRPQPGAVGNRLQGPHLR